MTHMDTAGFATLEEGQDAGSGTVVHADASMLPVIHVISDSIGITAQNIARAAASQFGVTDPIIELLPNVKTIHDITRFLEEHVEAEVQKTGKNEILCFYTLVEGPTYDALQEYLAEHPHIHAVDLMSNAIHAIEDITGLKHGYERAVLRETDNTYYRRIEAMEFTIEHDDGRNPQDLTKADIVLLGVSRSSKTPTSIYLSQEGYKVANIPLDPSTEPPKEVYDVEPSRLFGLMISPEVLYGIRQRRLNSAEKAVAGEYASLEFIIKDLEKSRTLMRQLGCIVVHTDNRAVEETAQEILRYYEMAHPRSFVMPRL